MLFNSINFAIFFPIVFFIYWLILSKKLMYQNIFLLIASYFFYSWWDWRFLFLLLFSTGLDYVAGMQITQSKSLRKKRFWLILSVGLNLGFLGFFKYCNFFIDSFADLLQLLGFTPHISTLQIILPIGISFYTFHGLSYIFDIYNKKIQPTTNWVNYSLFVSFFPLLVAGPIERATHLIPQIENKRQFDYTKAVSGLKQILWGLFKKVVIADSCASYVNQIFDNYEYFSGSTLLLAAILFAFQIYGDFSGYSDIAIGTARILGFELLKNFNFPYFSRDIAEFWRRWHISLTTWFRDYIYIPLGGSRDGMLKTVRNIVIVFLISGFWHGSNWTFIAWGAINALFMIPSVIRHNNRKYLATVAQNSILPNGKELIMILSTFLLTCMAWIFFRSENIEMAFNILQTIFSESLFSIPEIRVGWLTLLLIAFMSVEWMGRKSDYAIENIGVGIKAMLLRWAFYAVLLFIIIANANKGNEFIYFQF